MTWHILLAHTGSPEQALAIVAYASLVVAFMLAILAQAAWLASRRVVRQYRVRRELDRVRDEAYQERVRAVGRVR